LGYVGRNYNLKDLKVIQKKKKKLEGAVPLITEG